MPRLSYRGSGHETIKTLGKHTARLGNSVSSLLAWEHGLFKLGGQSP